jgi:hypothetical protein
VEVTGLRHAFALRIGSARPTGRIWYLDWHAHRHTTTAATAPCASSWRWGGTLIDCLTSRRVEWAMRAARLPRGTRANLGA